MNNPEMRKWRFYFLFAIPALALLVLGGRVVQLQVCRGGQLSELAQRQQRRVIILPARHGNIFARTRTGYTLLAGSRRASSVYADPVLLGQERFVVTAGKVAAVLDCTDGELYDKLTQRRDKRFAYMVRDVTESQAGAVRNLKIHAIGVMGEWRRNYPSGPLAGQVLGFRLIDGQPGGGIELQADKWLSPRDGRKVLRCDAARRGRYADVVEYDPPEDGKNVVLTLDVSIQGFLEDALSETVGRFGAEAAMGVVMDPNTGAILAIASVPSCDPNRYNVTPSDHRRCRAITDPYEPGSVFKPFIVIAGGRFASSAVIGSDGFRYRKS
jgi:cell division protein FtsI (penicillin-binding protein 3)